ncbi:ATP synthase subunit I [Ottowia sp.]|uniref:ATP synthase subunit I n=1 Tax=Ottowia sp. TaxID=1898956 RepID=UPI002BBD2819|nr:ATP synthase subunit I [Ottowia sp.]HRN74288.1 ATP synthase subunit I [Ottowia sp.]HRQ01352.1 ATP synthase subunit I [Ottowia sp.]
MAEIPWQAVVQGLGLGILVSGLFFAGLAWSLRHALRARRPALVLLPSFLLRAGLLLGAGWWLMQHGNAAWSLLAYVLAFFVVRTMALRHARRGSAAAPPGPLEGS